MKIVHISDWHSVGMMVPKADVYVCTGDMLLNFPVCSRVVRRASGDRVLKYDRNARILGMDPEPGFAWNDEGEQTGYWIQRDHEEKMQVRWIRERLGSWRQYFASPDAPVVCVRGNHDFVPIAESFGGDVWEVDDDPSRTVTIGGLKFGGCRGVNTINGWWNDETERPDFDARVERIPGDIDVLITHSPPAGVLDLEGSHWGSPSISRMLQARSLVMCGNPPKLHCFGHVHAQHRMETIGSTIFSNASTGFNVIEV